MQYIFELFKFIFTKIPDKNFMYLFIIKHNLKMNLEISDFLKQNPS